MTDNELVVAVAEKVMDWKVQVGNNPVLVNGWVLFDDKTGKFFNPLVSYNDCHEMLDKFDCWESYRNGKVYLVAIAPDFTDETDTDFRRAAVVACLRAKGVDV